MLRNKLIFFSVLLVVLLLFGCGKQYENIVFFDNFKFEFDYINDNFDIYKGENDILKDFGKNVVLAYIDNTKIEDEEKRKYKSSLVIYKEHFSSNFDFDSYIKNNLNTIRNSFVDFEILSEDVVNIECNRSITAFIKEMQIGYSNIDVESLYFVQFFYIYENDIYIISFSTSDEDAKDMFVKGIKNINCFK